MDTAGRLRLIAAADRGYDPRGARAGAELSVLSLVRNETGFPALTDWNNSHGASPIHRWSKKGPELPSCSRPEEEEGGRMLSVQGLQELFVSLAVSASLPLPEARPEVVEVSSRRVGSSRGDSVREGIERAERWQVSFWDAMVLRMKSGTQGATYGSGTAPS